jgi:hypothetical protein
LACKMQTRPNELDLSFYGSNLLQLKAKLA